MAEQIKKERWYNQFLKYFKVNYYIPEIVNSRFDKLMKIKQESNIEKIQDWNFKVARLSITCALISNFCFQILQTLGSWN